MRLHVRAHQLNRAHHQRLNRVSDVVRLVQHVCRIEIRNAVELRINELVKNEKELKRFDRSRIEIVVPILAVVEMKTRELTKLNQPRDDHLDIDIRRVVTEVNEAERFWTKLPGAVVTRAPIVYDCGIERRLVKLVLD